MTFLDLPEPDDTEEPNEPEETPIEPEETPIEVNGDTGQFGELPAFAGLDKEIDDLRKQLRSEPGDTQLFRGSVTILLKEVAEGKEGANNKLFDLVMDQLEITAERALKNFRYLQKDPHDLINDFFPRLQARIAEERIKNRRHFFALASLNFRSDIRKELRKYRPLPIEAAADVPDPAATPAEFFEKEDLYFQLTKALDLLTEESRELIDMVFFMGFPFREIAAELEEPRSTVHDRYLRALEELKTILTDLSDDIED